MTGLFIFMILSLFAFPRSRFYSMVLLMIYSALILRNDKNSSKWKISIIPVMILVFFFSIFGAIASAYRINGEMHYEKVQVSQMRQDYPLMVGEVDKAYSWFFPLDPFITPLPWYKGMAYFGSNRLDDALREYEIGLTIHPNHLRLLNDIATTYEKKKQFDKAIYYYQKALRINPYFLEANLNLSAAFFNNNQFDSAFNSIDRIYDLNSKIEDNSNYNNFLNAILYAKAFEVINADMDTTLSEKYYKLTEDSLKLKDIYLESKHEKQAFAKFLKQYVKDH
jgi:tetratricopeptide (TPR) repeat protein